MCLLKNIPNELHRIAKTIKNILGTLNAIHLDTIIMHCYFVESR